MKQLLRNNQILLIEVAKQNGTKIVDSSQARVNILDVDPVVDVNPGIDANRVIGVDGVVDAGTLNDTDIIMISDTESCSDVDTISVDVEDISENVGQTSDTRDLPTMAEVRQSQITKGFLHHFFLTI